jgi:hypothetical protein
MSSLDGGKLAFHAPSVKLYLRFMFVGKKTNMQARKPGKQAHFQWGKMVKRTSSRCGAAEDCAENPLYSA